MSRAPSKHVIIWSIIGAGISSIAVQLVSIREFLTQFHGNEITISLVLFSWLLMTGIGSLLAKPFKRSNPTLYAFLILVTALWPLLQVLFIRGLRDIIFIHGVSPGFYQIFLYILATTTPYCLLVGFILPYALKVLTDSDYPFTSGQLYVTDNIGDICGGVLFSFVLVYWFNPFKTLALTSSLLIITALVILISVRKYLLLVPCLALAAVFYLFCLNSDFERTTLSGQYGDILNYTESPYGRIVITKEGPQHTFWESGSPLYSDANIVNSEEKVHYALSQLEHVENVLLVSGGLGETLGEIAKHQPERVDYVELDPLLTGIAQGLGFIKKTSGLSIINSDGRQYIKNTDRKYDAIIIDLPDPDTYQINRFFTLEFFSQCKRVLNKEGILSFGMKYSPNYISEVRKKKLSIIYGTARSLFENVWVLPGAEAYFLCRDGRLWEDIPARLAAKAVSTAYIEGFYYGNVTQDRIRQLKENLTQVPQINRDFEPRIMGIMFQEWFHKHGTSPRIFLLALLGLALLYVIFMRKEEFILFSTGLATMGVEMLVIFTFQIIYGYIYLKIGAVVTVFLMGLLPGAILGHLHREKGRLSLMVSDIILLCLLCLFFLWLRFFSKELHQIYFLAYCFVFSFFCGYQFPAATSVIGEEKSPAAGCIAADLTGAALGTIITGTLLIPLMGIQSAIIFLILIKISSNILILLTKKKGLKA